jgi:hypothetical protein
MTYGDVKLQLHLFLTSALLEIVTVMIKISIDISKGKSISWSIIVAARSGAWTVWPRSNTTILGSNPTRGMDVCIVCVYSLFVLFCV